MVKLQRVRDLGIYRRSCTLSVIDVSMIITRIQVKNFRSILNEKIDCSPLTALVGPNGSGKSTFLRALEIFYSPTPKVVVDDFYNRDTLLAIEIAVTFGALTLEAENRFTKYLENGNLTVTRVISLKDGKVADRLHGSRLQNPDFGPIRDATNKTNVNALYKKLRENADYSDLPAPTSADTALVSLEAWEMAHPERCSWQPDQGKFFGFKEVGQGYLKDFTDLIVIPAVRDAADESVEGKGSAITQLIDLLVRSTLANSEELKSFTEEAKKRYDDVMRRDTVKQKLNDLSNALGITLKTYVPTAGIDIEWMTDDAVTVSLPRADVKLLEDSYPGPVDRVGHGLQRALILTLLQHLAEVKYTTIISEDQAAIKQPLTAGAIALSDRGIVKPMLPSLVLTIDEPELYQHPSRQRHLANVLLKLSNGVIPGVTAAAQVIYTTHSPYFVGIDRFDQIRIVRKTTCAKDKPRITTVTQTDMDTVAGALWEACVKKERIENHEVKFTGNSLRPRLQCLMTLWMSESFFADVVVLVEGEGDRAAILGSSIARGHDFESMGIAVIPCGGKASMDRPALIFKSLEIPTYLVWDGDDGDGKGVRTNHILQHIVGVEAVDYPSVFDNTFTCLRTNLETTLREELGTEYDKQLAGNSEKFGYNKPFGAEKNPFVMAQVIREAANKGKISSSLDTIVDHILVLHSKSN